jgi:hypothetical protein
VPPQLVEPVQVAPGWQAGAPVEPQVTHAPLLQNRPAPQAVPHWPQFMASDWGLTSHPLALFRSQSR